MADTTITRSGSFDPNKLNNLEQQLRTTPTLPPTAQVYGSPTGLYALWVSPGLTNPQKTTATSVINAYVEKTDLSELNSLQLQAYNYLQLPSPTVAQSQAALKQVIKLLLRISASKDDIDGFDLTF